MVEKGEERSKEGGGGVRESGDRPQPLAAAGLRPDVLQARKQAPVLSMISIN